MGRACLWAACAALALALCGVLASLQKRPGSPLADVPGTVEALGGRGWTSALQTFWAQHASLSFLPVAGKAAAGGVLAQGESLGAGATRARYVCKCAPPQERPALTRSFRNVPCTGSGFQICAFLSRRSEGRSLRVRGVKRHQAAANTSPTHPRAVGDSPALQTEGGTNREKSPSPPRPTGPERCPDSGCAETAFTMLGVNAVAGIVLGLTACLCFTPAGLVVAQQEALCCFATGGPVDRLIFACVGQRGVGAIDGDSAGIRTVSAGALLTKEAEMQAKRPRRSSKRPSTSEDWLSSSPASQRSLSVKRKPLSVPEIIAAAARAAALAEAGGVSSVSRKDRARTASLVPASNCSKLAMDKKGTAVVPNPIAGLHKQAPGRAAEGGDVELVPLPPRGRSDRPNSSSHPRLPDVDLEGMSPGSSPASEAKASPGKQASQPQAPGHSPPGLALGTAGGEGDPEPRVSPVITPPSPRNARALGHALRKQGSGGGSHFQALQGKASTRLAQTPQEVDSWDGLGSSVASTTVHSPTPGGGPPSPRRRVSMPPLSQAEGSGSAAPSGRSSVLYSLFLGGSPPKAAPPSAPQGSAGQLREGGFVRENPLRVHGRRSSLGALPKSVLQRRGSVVRMPRRGSDSSTGPGVAVASNPLSVLAVAAASGRAGAGEARQDDGRVRRRSASLDMPPQRPTAAQGSTRSANSSGAASEDALSAARETSGVSGVRAAGQEKVGVPPPLLLAGAEPGLHRVQSAPALSPSDVAGGEAGAAGGPGPARTREDSVGTVDDDDLDAVPVERPGSPLHRSFDPSNKRGSLTSA